MEAQVTSHAVVKIKHTQYEWKSIGHMNVHIVTIKPTKIIGDNYNNMEY